MSICFVIFDISLEALAVFILDGPCAVHFIVVESPLSNRAWLWYFSALACELVISEPAHQNVACLLDDKAFSTFDLVVMFRNLTIEYLILIFKCDCGHWSETFEFFWSRPKTKNL